jgi:PadR family transcriptional regulator PadR
MIVERFVRIRRSLSLDTSANVAVDLGGGMPRRITQITNGTFEVKAGPLFPALHGLEQAGWLVSSWGESETNRRAQFGRLTRSGRNQLPTESERWERIPLAMASALRAT